MSDRVLLLGGGGLLGRYLLLALEDDRDVVTASRRDPVHPCDVTDEMDLQRLVTSVAPSLIINTVALTNVDACESQPEKAHALHVQAVEALARQASSKTRLVHISTDQVYPDTPGPHSEDAAAPVNEYGRSKLEGEVHILARDGLVLRTNFFGPSLTPGRPSYSDVIIQCSSSPCGARFPDNEQFSPLHLRTLARITARLIAMGVTGRFNVGSRNGMRRAEFARAVAAHAGGDPNRLDTRPREAAGALRSHDLRMDVRKLEDVLAESMPHLEAEVAEL